MTTLEADILLLIRSRHRSWDKNKPDCETVPAHMLRALREERGLVNGQPVVLDGVRLVEE